MNLSTPGCLAAVLTLAIAGTATAGDWIDLLPDGDLSKHWVTEGNWQVNDNGEIELTPRPGEKGWSRYNMYLWVKSEPIADFEIEFEYMLEPKGNSGLYFRVGDKLNATANGIEVQIYDTPSRGNKRELNDHDAGGVIRGVPPTKNVAKPAGEWNKMHVTLQGEDLKVVLNGELVNEININKDGSQQGDRNAKGVNDGAPKGHIGFQDHGLPMKLRNLRLKKL